MKTRLKAWILCLSVLAVAPMQGQALAIGYQYALVEEYISGYVMLFDVLGPVGVYSNFYGIGVTDYPDYESPWPGDELMFTIDKQYWAAQSVGATLSLFPGVYLYAGYCNGYHINVQENTWFDETYILSWDGFYTTQEQISHVKPGFDVGVNIFPITYMGMVIGYNSSLNSLVLGLNTTIYF
ncbi:MAG: hypothetical protein KAT14_01495 [Candidatus Marinimicrobia bacterium]|nr:hypothetical protein [Candidatus Neomarinimicrobiota bacterium]